MAKRRQKSRPISEILKGVGILLGSAVGLSFLIQAATAPDSASRSPQAKGSFFVYEGAKDCQSHSGLSCSQDWRSVVEMARKSAWPYREKGRCEAAYGNCVQVESKTWAPPVAGFAVYKDGYGSYRSVIPVYSSTVYPGLYLANGYPVVIGKNTISEALMAGGLMKAYHPQDLNETKCAELKGEKVCKPLHEFVTGIRIDQQALVQVF